MINSKVVKVAKELRKNMTEAEKILWQELRNRRLNNIKFRRQFPLVFGDNNFVADFYSAEKKLIIEIDGGIHGGQEIKECDNYREDIIMLAGYQVLRFKNEEVVYSIKKVLKKIMELL
jgi:very-short-patch-repair endonuclease